MAPTSRFDPSAAFTETLPPADTGSGGADAAEDAEHLGGLLEAIASAEGPGSLTEMARPAGGFEVRQVYGRVESVASSTLVVRVGDRLLTTRRAVSCLVEPAVGDRVLVAWSDESFVLAVLARRVDAHARATITLSAEGDVTLRARGGALGLASNEAVTVTSSDRVEINTPELAVRAMKTSFFSSSLAYVGKVLDGEIDRVTLVARTVDRTIERVTERLKRSFRTIEEIERVKAQELDVDVEGGVSVHADSAVVSAEKLVKIDGEQIHLG
jgi:hypothetical protein